MSTKIENNSKVEVAVPIEYLLENFQNLRIIQPSLIFIHGIPEFLSNPNKLTQQISIYGAPNKMSIQKISKDFYSAFISFDHPFSAALAILGLNEFELANRKIRASYGSTKFCPWFLKNQNCCVLDCNYAHFYDPSLTFYKQLLQDFNHRQFAQNQLRFSKLLYAKTYLLNCFSSPKNKQHSLFPSGQKLIQDLQQTTTSNQEDEWDELHSEIDTFIQEDSEAQKQNKKTRIQQLLDEAEKKLMQLIFKSAIM